MSASEYVNRPYNGCTDVTATILQISAVIHQRSYAPGFTAKFTVNEGAMTCC